MAKTLLSRTITSLARGLDRAFTGTALRPSAAPRGKAGTGRLDYAASLRGLGLIRAFYDTPEAMEREGRFFPRPAPIAVTRTRVRKLRGGGEVLDLRWPSEFEPLWSVAELQSRVDALPPAERLRFGLPERVDAAALLSALGIDRSAGLREKYARLRANRTAHARWFRHGDGPRTCAVLLHGYLGGNFALEERVLPVRRLFDAGLDVVLSVLPLHGPRRSELRGFRPPAFPSSDPRFTIEGFRQLVFDQRGLLDFLRADGARGVGLLGMSLGGYSAALLATLEAGLDFTVLFIPLAAIEDFAHTHGRTQGSEAERAALRDALRAAQRSISPLSRPPLISAERVVVVAGESDLVTGLAHAELLAKHFHTPVSSFAGGHLLHLGRERAFAPVWSLLSVPPLGQRVAAVASKLGGAS